MNVDVKSNPNLVEVKNLVKYYPVLGGVFKRVVAHVKAVDDVSFRYQSRGNTWDWLVNRAAENPPSGIP